MKIRRLIDENEIIPNVINFKGGYICQINFSVNCSEDS